MLMIPGLEMSGIEVKEVSKHLELNPDHPRIELEKPDVPLSKTITIVKDHFFNRLLNLTNMSSCPAILPNSESHFSIYPKSRASLFLAKILS